MHGRSFSPRPGSSGSRPYTRPVQKGKRLHCRRQERDDRYFTGISRLDINGITVSFANSSEGDQ
jgi:hypothetical protein